MVKESVLNLNFVSPISALLWFITEMYHLFLSVISSTAPKAPRKTRAEMMKFIDADYYGYRDEDDGVLVPLETEHEKNSKKNIWISLSLYLVVKSIWFTRPNGMAICDMINSEFLTPPCDKNSTFCYKIYKPHKNWISGYKKLWAIILSLLKII